MASSFEQALLRFKNQLQVQSDKQVAEQLGMSPTAFNDRKKRDAFPEDKVWALATQRPDLRLDVNYILTGITGAAKALLDAKQDRISRAVDLGMDSDGIRAMERIADPASVDEIVRLLHECRATERDAVHTLLKSIVGLREAQEAAQSDSQTTRPSTAAKPVASSPKHSPKPDTQPSFTVRKVVGQNIQGNQTNHAPQYFGVQPTTEDKAKK